MCGQNIIQKAQKQKYVGWVLHTNYLKGERHFVGCFHQIKQDHLLIPFFKYFVNKATSFGAMINRVQSFVAVPASLVAQWARNRLCLQLQQLAKGTFHNDCEGFGWHSVKRLCRFCQSL